MNDTEKAFEKGLEEILTPGADAPASVPRSTTGTKNGRKNLSTVPRSASAHAKNKRQWVHTVIRIIAGIIVVVLLFLFGVHIAQL